MAITYSPADSTDWTEDGAPTAAATAIDQLAAERADGWLLYCADNSTWYRATLNVSGGVTQLKLAEA